METISDYVARVTHSAPLTALSLALAPAIGSFAFGFLLWISSSVSASALATVETLGLSLLAYSIFIMAAEIEPLEHLFSLLNCWFQEVLEEGEEDALGIATCTSRYPETVAYWEAAVTVIAGMIFGFLGFRALAGLLRASEEDETEKGLEREQGREEEGGSWAANIARRLHLVVGVFLHATLEGLALALAVEGHAVTASSRLARGGEQLRHGAVAVGAVPPPSLVGGEPNNHPTPSVSLPQRTTTGGAGSGGGSGGDMQTIVVAMLFHNIAEGSIMAATFGASLFHASSSSAKVQSTLGHPTTAQRKRRTFWARLGSVVSRVLQPMILAVMAHSGQALMFLGAMSQQEEIIRLTSDSELWQLLLHGMSGFCVGTMLGALFEEIAEFFE